MYKKTANGGFSQDLAWLQTQKSRSVSGFFALFNAWQFPTLAWGDPTLPSALRRFTSEFGMGSGGTTALSPPSKFFLPNKTPKKWC